MGIAGSRDELRTRFEYLAVFVALPILGRAVGDLVLKKLLNAGCKKCCEKTTDEMKEALNPVAGDGDSGVTWCQIEMRKIKWSEAAEARGLNKCAAYFVSTVVLVCWHWLQPLLYWLCLYLYWDLLDWGQQRLGCLVAGREGIYWLLTVIGCFTNPAYLLIDIKATWREKHDKQYVLLYIFAPEKYVFTATGVITNYKVENFLAFLLILLDFFGIAALVAAIVSGNMYPAMMIGYIVTTLGGLFLLVAGVGAYCGFIK